MAAITTGNHPKALWPGIHAWWGAKYAEHPEECVHLFETKKSGRNYEELGQTVGFGLAPTKTEGGGTHYDTHTQGWTKRYVHTAYGLGYIVTREERDDNLYKEVSMQRAASLAFSMRQTRENVAANVYNRATNSSYVGGDGIELFSLLHPDANGGTFANELATPANLSEASLEDIVIQIMNAKNPKGLRVSIMPTTLIVPTALVFEATRILKSTLQNDTANNATNALRSLGSVPSTRVNHYLTSTTQWHVRTNVQQGMTCFNRVAAEFAKDNDFNTDNALAKGYERYSYGWTDPRGLYGSAGV